MPAWLTTRPACWAMLLFSVAWCAATFQGMRGGTLEPSWWWVLTSLTTSLTALILLATLWLTDFDEPHDYDEWRALRWFVYALQGYLVWVFWHGMTDGTRPGVLAAIVMVFCASTYATARRAVWREGHRKKGEPFRQAWLVVQVDLRTEPPSVVGAGIFSCKASSLTTISPDLLNLDVTWGEGNSFGEARQHIVNNVSLWYPKLVPLLRKRGEEIPE